MFSASIDFPIFFCEEMLHLCLYEIVFISGLTGEDVEYVLYVGLIFSYVSSFDYFLDH